MNEQDSVNLGPRRPDPASDAGQAQPDPGSMAGGRDNTSQIGLIARSASSRQSTPAELWNPPYCGDIGLAIARDGTWSYRGSPIPRLPLVKLFASILRREEDGRHFLVTPVEKVDVTVADAPFIAVDMTVQGSGIAQTIVLRTNLDDIVTVGDTHPLRFDLASDGAMKPYVRVRGRLDALLTRSLTYDLAELMVAGPDGRLGIWSGDAFFPAV